MKSTLGRRVLLAAATAFILACSVLTAAALGAKPMVRHCSSAQLRLKFVDKSAATGHRFIDYAFKNVGARKCTLRGFPSVKLLGKHGSVLHSARARVGRWSISKARTVVIAPGKRAFFSFMWLDGAFCPGNSFAFYALRVFPPTNTNGFHRHFGKTPACSGSAMVSRVRPKLLSF